MANTLIREDTSAEPTGIVDIEHGTLNIEHYAGGWYTINGLPLTRKPTAKGIYIYNGRKVVIK
jgi:hypothetical protein